MVMMGSEKPDEEHRFMLICGSMFVGAWFNDGADNCFGGDGGMWFADYYTIGECLYFMTHVWNWRRNLKILEYREVESDERQAE